MNSYKKPTYLREMYDEEWIQFKSLAAAAEWLHKTDQSDKPVSTQNAYQGLIRALKTGTRYKNYYVKQK